MKVPRDPDDGLGFQSSKIGKELPQMSMVSVLQLIGVTPFWWTGLDLRFLDVGTISFRS